MSEEKKKKPDLLRKSDIRDKYGISLDEMRRHIARSAYNGLWKCIYRMPRLVYFEKEKFERWLEEEYKDSIKGNRTDTRF